MLGGNILWDYLAIETRTNAAFEICGSVTYDSANTFPLAVSRPLGGGAITVIKMCDVFMTSSNITAFVIDT